MKIEMWLSGNSPEVMRLKRNEISIESLSVRSACIKMVGENDKGGGGVVTMKGKSSIG